MQPYANRRGNSNVVAFEIAEDSIVVEFRDGWKYQFTDASVGPRVLEHMKTLARQGFELNSFINLAAKDAYARKFLGV